MKNEPCCETCKYHDGVCMNEDIVLSVRQGLRGAAECNFFSFCAPREYCCNYYKAKENK